METAAAANQEQKPRCAVGLDIGSASVKCILASLDNLNNPQVIASASRPNRGMRKGNIVDITMVAKAVDAVLGDIEGLTGYNVTEASINVNGAEVSSMITEGMIATGPSGHIISAEDVNRLREVVLTGKIPPNKQILDFYPLEYTIDGQGGIRDPRGMIGSRLEVKMSAIFSMSQNLATLNRAMELVNVSVLDIVPSSVAASRAVLDDRQVENGVVMIDFGAATTGLAIFEEGELRFTSVVPLGSNHITNDLAMGLTITPDVAEIIKCEKLGNSLSDNDGEIIVDHNGREYIFGREEVNEIVDARLEEIFDAVRDELKKAGYDRKLPEGAVLVGGGAKLGILRDYVEKKLEMVVKTGSLKDISSVDDLTSKLEFSAAVGLMLESLKHKPARDPSGGASHSKKSGSSFGFIKKFIGKFK